MNKSIIWGGKKKQTFFGSTPILYVHCYSFQYVGCEHTCKSMVLGDSQGGFTVSEVVCLEKLCSMVPPNHPFVHRVGTIIKFIHFGGFPPILGLTPI